MVIYLVATQRTSRQYYIESLLSCFPLRSVNRVPERSEFVRLFLEQGEQAGDVVAVHFKSALGAAEDRHVDDGELADDVMEPVDDVEGAEFLDDGLRLAAKRDRPRKRGFQAVEHGDNSLGLLYEPKGIKSGL